MALAPGDIVVEVDGEPVHVREADIPAFEKMMRERHAAQQEPAAPQTPQDVAAGTRGFLTALADSDGGRPAVDTGEGQPGDLLRGLEFEAGRFERGISQLGATPAEKLALAKEEEAAREAFAPIDEGIGIEDAGEAAVLIGSLVAPVGGGVVQAATNGRRVLQVVKNLPKSWGGVAAVTGLVEGLKGVAPDESRAGNASATAGAAAVGGVAGQKIGKTFSGAWEASGAGKTMLAMLGTRVGQRQSQRIFQEGWARKFARWVGLTRPINPKDPQTDAALRVIEGKSSPQTRQLHISEAQAKAQALQKQVTPNSRLETAAPTDLLSGFRTLVKSIGLKKSLKEQGRTVGDVRTEVGTMFAMLERNFLKTDPATGRASVDLVELRAGVAALKADPKFIEIFTPAKIKKLDQLVDDYSELALKGSPGVVDIGAPFEVAEGKIDADVEKALTAQNDFLASMMDVPKKKFGKHGIVGAVQGWMLQQEQDTGAFISDLANKGWLEILDMYETIDEEVLKDAEK